MADIRISNVGPDVSSQFSELMTAQKTSIIELTSTYGLSDLRDIVTTAGTGTVTNNATEFVLTTTGAADSAILDSAERGRYEPGYACESGIAVRQPAAPVGSQTAQWGLYDSQNGAFFGNSSTNIYVGIRRAGTDTLIPQASWNVDPLNGTGPSGVTLDLADGNIFLIVFTWYGYGVIEFRVVVPNPVTLAQEVITVHRFDPSGQTSFTDPNLPLRAEVENNGTAAPFNLFVGGRQYSIIGKFEPVFRNTSERRTVTNITTTLTPLISFTRKPVFPAGSGRPNSVQVLFESAEIITNVDLAFQVIIGGTVNGTFTTFPTATTNIPNNETALLVNTTSTTITGGEVVFQGLAAASGSSSTRVLTTELLLDTELPDNEIVTLAVASLGGPGTNTVTAMFRVTENW
ncbi:hypothetical protein [Metabacillus indicus]|uniref:Virion structural protein n=1 Tax=Metabacillus indicus TaxID=246786 RepID=A0A084H4C0_METID|nr:hypothetical protein [Metabacillus indicus]KEZ54432.1 hypothetical protein GS18_0205840 [Metabacillus indicus]